MIFWVLFGISVKMSPCPNDVFFVVVMERGGGQ